MPDYLCETSHFHLCMALSSEGCKQSITPTTSRTLLVFINI